MASGEREEPRGTDRRRRELLSAARSLFARQGFEGTTMQQVVDEAGTSIGNCYFYFENKRELYLAVIREVNEEIAGRVDRALQQMDSLPEKLAAAVYAGFIAAVQESETTGQVLIGTAHPEIRGEVIRYFTDRIRRFLNHHREHWPDISPEYAAHAWQGAMFHFLERTMSGGMEESPEEVGRFLVRWNLRALGVAAEKIESAVDSLDRLKGK